VTNNNSSGFGGGGYGRTSVLSESPSHRETALVSAARACKAGSPCHRCPACVGIGCSCLQRYKYDNAHDASSVCPQAINALF
jgi:hypothetical protein